jgi:hypothetical protein
MRRYSIASQGRSSTTSALGLPRLGANPGGERWEGGLSLSQPVGGSLFCFGSTCPDHQVARLSSG